MSSSPDPFGELRLRMAQVLRACREKEGGDLQLARAITRADAHARGLREMPETDAVDRRKLKRIIDGDPTVVFRVHELVALEHYLKQFGEGLSQRPLFESRAILQRLAEGPEIAFLLGSRAHDSGAHDFHTVQHSRWDVQAMAEIQRGVGRFSTVIRFDILDVFLEDNLTAARRSVKDPWVNCLDQKHLHLVALGAPRASHASEIMLSRMFDLKPFEKTPDFVNGPPFHFIRPERVRRGVPSTFSARGQDLLALDNVVGRMVAQENAWALRFEGEVLAAEHGRNPITYGVVVVQRRANGQIWLVCAGLSGPGTIGAALSLPSSRFSLPETLPGQTSPVYGIVVEVEIRKESRRSSQAIRHADSWRIVRGPMEWA